MRARFEAACFYGAVGTLMVAATFAIARVDLGDLPEPRTEVEDIQLPLHGSR